MAELPVDPAHYASLRELDADGGFVRELMGIFLGNAASMVGDLQAALAAGDTAQIGKIAHKFKSAAGSVGATALRTAAARVEQEARSAGRCTGKLLEDVFAEHQRTDQYIRCEILGSSASAAKGAA